MLMTVFFLPICIFIINSGLILFTITVQGVMCTFKNLRSKYSHELHKIRGSQISGAGADDVLTSTWVYFDSLDAFLRPHVTMTNLVKMTSIIRLVNYFCYTCLVVYV